MDELLKYIPESEPERASVLELPAPKPWHRLSVKALIAFGIGIALVLVAIYRFFLSAPSDFPVGIVYEIQSGETLSGVARGLSSERLVRSGSLVEGLLLIFAPWSGPVSGDYQFDHPQSVLSVAWRIANGSYGLSRVKVTIPEGKNSSEIAAIFVKNGAFHAFDATAFKKLASQYEGYLFPDTYFFLPSVTAEEVVKTMVDTYKKRVVSIASAIKAFGRPTNDIIAMASIIEKEAGSSTEERETIAGILWKRLDEGMPLQVDAASSTYAQKGLPSFPISNPGIATILAAVEPLSTPFYFYLHGKDGKVHYAVSLDQHLVNTGLYLR